MSERTLKLNDSEIELIEFALESIGNEINKFIAERRRIISQEATDALFDVSGINHDLMNSIKKGEKDV